MKKRVKVSECRSVKELKQQGQNALSVGGRELHRFAVALMMIMAVLLMAAVFVERVEADTVDLPQTGQTTCYDQGGNAIACAGTGQDGEKRAGVSWPSPRFTDNGNGTVTDKLTGLIWLKNGNCFGARTWANALSDANTLNSTECGLSDGSVEGDWRLPNINELESLANAGTSDTAAWLNSQGFSGVQSNYYYYWSSSTYATDTAFAELVNMTDGSINAGNKTVSTNRYVLPVRGTTSAPAKVWQTGQTPTSPINPAPAGSDGDLQKGAVWPNPRFTDNNNGTVTDNLIGLIWLKNAYCSNATRNWETALSDVAQLNTNGTMNGNNCDDTSNGGSHQTDWRLPNRKELMSLMDRSKFDMALPNGYPFSNVSSGAWWSSSTHPDAPSNAFYLVADDSRVLYNFKTDLRKVWPVRGGSGFSGNPDISPAPASKDFGNVNSGSSSAAQTFTITNNGTNNLYITTVSITGGDAGQFSKSNDNCANQTIAPAGTCTVKATFSPTSAGAKSANLTITSNDPDTASLDIALSGTGIVQYTITVTKAGTGTGTVTAGANCTLSWGGAGNNTGTCTVNDGTTITLSGTANAGSAFTGWSGGTGSAAACAGAGDCSFNLTADSGVTATFTLNQYTITITQTAGGTIVCNPTTVNHGSNSNCTITPDADYDVNIVTVDGTPQGAITTYQFSNVTANHTITATYTYNPPPAPEPEPQPQPEPQVINNNNPLINYGRGWYSRNMPGSYSGLVMQGSGAGGAGSPVSFTFTGSSIQWRAMMSPHGGTARVYIDGQYAGRVSLQSGNTVFDANVFNWSGSNGSHTITIVLEPALPGFSVNIDRFIVQ